MIQKHDSETKSFKNGHLSTVQKSLPNAHNCGVFAMRCHTNF